MLRMNGMVTAIGTRPLLSLASARHLPQGLKTQLLSASNREVPIRRGQSSVDFWWRV